MTHLFRVPNKTLYLAHINYTVRFRYKKPPPSISTAQAWTKRDHRSGCTVYLTTARVNPATLAHEFVHVLRYICIDRYMEFDDESEHMAYIMQYLMGQALNLEYDKLRADGTSTSGKRKVKIRTKKSRAAVSRKIIRR